MLEVLTLVYSSTRCLLHLLPTFEGTSAVNPPDVGRAESFDPDKASLDASMVSCIVSKLRALRQITLVPCFR